MSTSNDLHQLYSLLDELRERQAGYRKLAECHGRMAWPERGVYFFFEEGEYRTGSGSGLRVTRIGTHALKLGSKTKLWNRLSQHRGNAKTSNGNHRGSIFRLLVGGAIGAKLGMVTPPSWGVGQDIGKAATKCGLTRERIHSEEKPFERLVSRKIGAMPLLVLSVADEAGPDSVRGYIERNAIALVSHASRDQIDPASSDWLGRCSDRAQVVGSGLWNINHVHEDYDPAFLDVMSELILE